ncbi:nitroreductase family protein [Tsukamurella sp. 8F]|uniref:nitroreductase family protein n=1 Tax=unclassified Tsukamurella TaxID=2633480 RepID=UPI0023B95678|nr:MULTISPECIES: nitroreductase family protein [unclassified Tsukamurella]MDF0532082.1 nitroreductase family protein [Tsukamurella sp. 8J]MDF0589194.1 nitroreductase family protein [Tsukamurella sp. 8F]
MHELFERRASTRALDPATPVTRDQLTDILDAARWAPTWGGAQPVRFAAGLRGDAEFDALASALRRGNAWARDAGALVLVCTEVRAEQRPDRYADVDAGLATSQLILQAVAFGLVAHPMAGFYPDLVRETFGIGDGYRPMVMVAIGAPAPEDAPTRTRMPLSDVMFELRSPGS